MKQQWQIYNEKYSQLSTREQMLIALTGLIAVIFVLYFYIAEPTYSELAKLTQQNHYIANEINTIKETNTDLTQALKQHPNDQLTLQIEQKKQTLAKIDKALLTLTSKLVDPVQMRSALEQLLQMQKGVKLKSFEVKNALPIITAKAAAKDEQSLNKKRAKQPLAASNLYRHTIKLTLTGSYFQLRDYLAQLETLPWKFFWEKFNYKLIKYPKSELTIEIYSLSLKQEFIGV